MASTPICGAPRSTRCPSRRCSRPMPNGGVIITDWYANPKAPGERVKLTVSILDPDLRADALRVVRRAPGQPERRLGRRAGLRGDGAEARGHHPDPGPRPAPRRRPRLSSIAMSRRFDPLRPTAAGRRAGTRRAFARRQRQRQAQDLRAGDVPLSVGAHPHGPRPQLHDGRRPRPLPADAGPRSAPPDGLGRVRHAGRECGDGAQGPSGRMDLGEHRGRCARN